MMKSNEKFCSNNSMKNGENLIGTASYARAYLFVNLDKKSWQSGLEDANLSTAIKENLLELRKKGVKIIFFEGVSGDN